MIDKRILRLTPKRVFCPLCGEWHDWEGKTLQSYDEDNTYEYECNDVTVSIWADDDSIHIFADSPCDKLNAMSEIEAGLRDMEYDGTDPVIKIPYILEADEIICESECEDYCDYCGCCNFVKIGDNRDDDEDEYVFNVEFKFEFASRYFNKYSEADRREENPARQPSTLEATGAQHNANLSARETDVAQREAKLSVRETTVAQHEKDLSAREDTLAQREAELSALADTIAQREAELATKKKTNKEDHKMKFTGLAAQLYKHSPEENVELVKAWATKYQPVLKWVIPVAAVYGAYRILNSPEFDLSVNNISETCEKKLGFKLELLDNKRALKELMTIGGICASAYAAVNAISGVFGSQTEAKDISVEEVEAGMNQLESVSKNFAWIQPKTENMLPIACSVILVYVTLHKPKFSAKTTKKFHDLTEDFRIKIDTYIELAKLFIQEKLQINLSNEEEQKKLKLCAFLVALMAVFAFLYGKKVLGDKTAPEETGDAKERNIRESAEAFIQQAKAIMKKIAPTVYTTLISILVSKKLLMLEEQPEVIPAPAPDEENPPAPAESDTSPVIIDADT